MTARKKNILLDDHNAAAPLKSWDIFMEGYQVLQVAANDMQQVNRLAQKHAWQPAFNIKENLLEQRKVMLITDVTQTIVFASGNIRTMNGYLPAEVIGKTPKMFQGKDTSVLNRAIIGEAIRARQPFHVPLLNYKKNGDLYYCDIEGFPVFNKQQKLVHFVAFETLQYDH